MKLTTMESLYVSELQDLYSAEKQLLKALDKLAKNAENEDLQDGFRKHRQETELHIERLEKIFNDLDQSPGRHKCKGIEGIVEEGDELIKQEGEASIKDAGLIGAAQKSEHYEIAAYGTAVAHAEMLGRSEDARLLRQTLAEEKATDEKLSRLAESLVNQQAAMAGGDSRGRSNGRSSR